MDRTTRPYRRLAFLLAGSLSLVPAPAWAALGGAASTVDVDRVRMQGALLRIARAERFTTHEIQTASGTVVREFVAPNGIVFGVAWQGPWHPDLRQLFGDYFDRYQAAALAARQGRRRGPVIIQDSSLVVQITGHPRGFSGRAYLTDLVPPGVEPETIR